MYVCVFLYAKIYNVFLPSLLKVFKMQTYEETHIHLKHEATHPENLSKLHLHSNTQKCHVIHHMELIHHFFPFLPDHRHCKMSLWFCKITLFSTICFHVWTDAVLNLSILKIYFAQFLVSDAKIYIPVTTNME